MGYTRYWNVKRTITRDEWKIICDKVEIILENATLVGIYVQFEYDMAKPAKINRSYILFNGVAEDGHETFMFHRVKSEKNDSFVKTIRKPYDRVVMSVLLAIKEVLKDDIEISCDDLSNINIRNGHNSLGNEFYYPEDYLLYLTISLRKEE
jgi:hypothetical protein